MVTTIYSSIPVEWRGPDADVSYPDATAFMEARARDIAAGQAAECVWLLEHPSLYTAGTSAKDTDLLAPARFPVFNTGRGGQYTYHGPGQRVAYVMLDLRNRGRDVGAFVRTLEQWIIDTFAEFDVIAERRTGRVGVWVSHPGGREEKIAAIGIRLKKWISFHGISLNVNPDLSHFGGIIPCGISEHGVTSLSALYDKGLSQKATLRDVDVALKTNFQKLLGPTSA